MNKLQRITLGLALAATLAAGASNASAKQGEAGGRHRALSGTILRVDLRTRTLEVREDGSGRVVNVRVPEGATVRTNLASQPIVPIERLLPGMSIRSAVQ
jgi:hypothetical protein